MMQNNIDMIQNARIKRIPETSTTLADEEKSYHFIAYLPSNGVVWELDGLRRQPVRIGKSWKSDII
jgi:hypothetical protein